MGESLVQCDLHRDQKISHEYKAWLQNTLGGEEEEIASITDQFISQETAFFQSLGGYAIAQNEASFNRVTSQFRKLKSLFQTIESSATPVVEVDSQALENLEEAIENYGAENQALKHQASALEDENSHLRDKLHSSTETMNSVIDEYSMMFSQKGDQDALQQSKTKMLSLIDQLTKRLQAPAPSPPADAAQ